MHFTSFSLTLTTLTSEAYKTKNVLSCLCSAVFKEHLYHHKPDLSFPGEPRQCSVWKDAEKNLSQIFRPLQTTRLQVPSLVERLKSIKPFYIWNYSTVDDFGTANYRMSTKLKFHLFKIHVKCCHLPFLCPWRSNCYESPFKKKSHQSHWQLAHLLGTDASLVLSPPGTICIFKPLRSISQSVSTLMLIQRVVKCFLEGGKKQKHG